MRHLTVPSGAVALRSDQPLAPAMVACVWEISDALDERRVPAEVTNSVWLEIPTRRLRGDHGRRDNVWLRECLRRLTRVELSGEHRGNPWGAVVLAEWEIIENGALARLLVPPSGVLALRAPATFAKIEEHAAHRLTGHACQLYALLADRRRQRRPHWEYGLDELRTLLNVDGRSSYRRFNTFRQRVLDPAVRAVNDYGTVAVRMTPRKLGRSVVAVRFDWSWKDPREATETAAENERHSAARRQDQAEAGAPPLIPEKPQRTREELAGEWWQSLPEAEREAWREEIGAVLTLEGPGGTVTEVPRGERSFAREAYSRLSDDGAGALPDLARLDATGSGR